VPPPMCHLPLTVHWRAHRVRPHRRQGKIGLPQFLHYEQLHHDRMIDRRQHCHEVGWKVGFEGAGEGFVVAEVADDDVAARVGKAGAGDEQVAQLRQVGPLLRRNGDNVDVGLPRCGHLMEAWAFSGRTNKASKEKNNAWLKEIYAVLIVC